MWIAVIFYSAAAERSRKKEKQFSCAMVKEKKTFVR
jgi:hypothetical protein